MITIAYQKLLSPVSILNTAVQMVECGNADGISLRAVASALGVEAPSLYRYFPQKEALQLAVANEALQAMLAGLQTAAAIPDLEGRFRETAQAYLRFARERFALYSFLMIRVPETHGSGLARLYGTSCWKRQAASPDSQTTPALLLLPGPFCMATPS